MTLQNHCLKVVKALEFFKAFSTMNIKDKQVQLSLMLKKFEKIHKIKQKYQKR